MDFKEHLDFYDFPTWSIFLTFDSTAPVCQSNSIKIHVGFKIVWILLRILELILCDFPFLFFFYLHRILFQINQIRSISIYDLI